MYKLIYFIYFFKKCLSIEIFEVDISFSESDEKSFKNFDIKLVKKIKNPKNFLISNKNKIKKNEKTNNLKSILLHEIKQQDNKSKDNKSKDNKSKDNKSKDDKSKDDKLQNKNILNIRNKLKLNDLNDKKQKYTNEMKKIKSNINILKILKNNIKILNELNINKNLFKIKNITIYKDSKTNEIVDFWNFLKFNKKNGKYIDKTGFFEGILKNDYNELIKTSKLSKIGLWLEITVTIDEDNENLYKIKKLITEIIKYKKIIKDFKELNNKNLNLIDELIFYNKYPLKDNDILTICICTDNNCENNCEEIRKIYRKDIL